MHPQLEQLAHQAHVDDLRREAEQQRRTARVVRRRARAEDRARTWAPVPALPPTVHDVLVFAERQPNRSEVAQLLRQLGDLRDDVVTTIVHDRHPALRSPVDESGSHSLSLPMPDVRMPAPRSPSEAEHRLVGVVDELRAAGHDARGELVAGPVSRALAEQVRERRPEAVILLTGRHRLAHLARRDMERQLRRQTSAPVVVLRQGRAAREG